MDGVSNGGHQFFGCVLPVSPTKCIGKLLQANLPYFREPGFVPMSPGIGANEQKRRTLP